MIIPSVLLFSGAAVSFCLTGFVLLRRKPKIALVMFIIAIGLAVVAAHTS